MDWTQTGFYWLEFTFNREIRCSLINHKFDFALFDLSKYNEKRTLYKSINKEHPARNLFKTNSA